MNVMAPAAATAIPQCVALRLPCHICVAHTGSTQPFRAQAVPRSRLQLWYGKLCSGQQAPHNEALHPPLLSQRPRPCC